MPEISIGSDHRGFELKQGLIAFLNEKGFRVKDFGCPSEESVDYPDIAAALARHVAETNTQGILICGTGTGMSIAANKVRGIRAACCSSIEVAEIAKKHNNANIICLGANSTDEAAAKKIIDTWLNASFEGGRHQRRVEKITAIEMAL
ncbi:ribose 5-phosphate isomerase B [Candidatus Woesearchaeota archaeon CG08_land_8_20_14_0_20_47_9]|nr:MAG: ribose 5-phosphate isomerase B [Candidatus Woesearchaeota archaeon CG08_land_8_20_14_0_20_47_9]